MNENGRDQEQTSEGKPWERPWSTDEMRQNAHAWNLAGDSGLLKHLQELSQAVISRTHATEKTLDSLVEEINTLTSEANTTNNKFLCLANTQFVENRVYDDDDKETPQNEAVPEKKTKEETEAKMLLKVREALSMSVAVLDTMFESVEIQASDSDGESENDHQGARTLILEPHNPYIHRPLPHLIGSEAFMTDDYVGLGDTPSDDDEESMKFNLDGDVEVSSESDVDFNSLAHPKRNREVHSSHSSVSDHASYQGKDQRKRKPIDPVGDDDVGFEKQNGSSTQSDVNFASQLSEKLKKIASPSTYAHSKTERDTTGTDSADDLFGRNISDEEDNALFAGNSGLFSGRPKLFDDVEDVNEPLWSPKTNLKETSSVPELQKTEQPASSKSLLTKPGDDLFSDSVFDDDDLFSTKVSSKLPTTATRDSKSVLKGNDSISAAVSKQNQLRVNNISNSAGTIGTVDGGMEESKNVIEADAVEERLLDRSFQVQTAGLIKTAVQDTANTSAKNDQDRKPTGGVPMFGQANVLAGLKAKFPRRPSSSSDSSSGDASDIKSSTLHTSQNLSPAKPFSEKGSSVAEAFGRDFTIPHQSPPPIQSSKISRDDSSRSKTVSNSISQVQSHKEIDSDDDDLFSSKVPTVFPQPYHQTSDSLFADVNDEEDDLFSVTQKENKIVINPGPEKKLTSKQIKEEITSSKSDREIPANNSSTVSSEKSFTHYEFPKNEFYSTVPPPLRSESKVKKPVSLFDDSDSGEDEFLFSSASSAGSRRSQASTDLLTGAAVSAIEKKPLSKKGLFDNDEELFGNARNDPDIDIFSASSKAMVDGSKVSKPSQPFLNQNLIEEEISDQTESITSNQDPSSKQSLVKKLVSTSKDSKAELTKSLFEDSTFDDNDDLFSNTLNSDSLKADNLFLPSKNKNIEDIVEASKTTESTDTSGTKPLSPEGKLFVPHPERIKDNSKIEEQTKLLSNVDENSEISNIFKKTSFKVEHISQSDNLLHRKPEPPRTLNIRNETDPGLGLLDGTDDDDDLFSSTSLKAILETVPPPLKQLPKPSVAADILFASSSNVVGETRSVPQQPLKPSISSKPSAKRDPVLKSGSHFPKKGALISDAAPERKSEISEIDGAAVSVASLRSALLAGGNGQSPLKLNPSTLLPGHKPPPRQTPSKDDSFMHAPGPDSKKSVAVPNEQPVGFDQPLINNATLPSANKDRAKLGVKRRPPSNKARREAARISQNLEQSDKESPMSPDMFPGVTDTTTTNNSIASSNSVMSPSTDEDDLFGVPQELPSEYGVNNMSSSDIFSGAPLLSPPVPESQVLVTKASQGTALVKENLSSLSNVKEHLPPFEDESKLSGKQFIVSKTDNFAKDNYSEQKESQEVEPSSSSYGNKFKVSSSNTETHTTSQQEPSSKHNVFPQTPSSYEGCVENPQNLKEENFVESNRDVFPGGLESSAVLVNNTPMSSSVTHETDPLNTVDNVLTRTECELFGSEDSKSGFDDHSSLFPFVRKKPESTSKQPLFAQTPTLPSKEDKSILKPDLGDLDDSKEDELFGSSSRALSAKKTQDISTTLKSKDSKAWNFDDDEDDDDLFQSHSKSIASLHSSSKESSSSAYSAAAATKNRTRSEMPKSHGPEKNTSNVKAATLAKNGLFNDDNDDDDLFSKPSQFMKNKLKGTSTSLFDDDDSDLFGSKVVTSRSTQAQKQERDSMNAGTQPFSSTKLKKEDVFDDPLQALQND